MAAPRPRFSLIYRSESTASDSDDDRFMSKFPASGWLCCAPFIISTAALALSFVATATCDLVTIENSDFFPFPARSAGLWCFTTLGGSAVSSVDIPADDKTNTARGCGSATLILGIIVWIFYCTAACCPFTPLLFRFVAFLCLCNTLFQGLVFLILQSYMCEQGCGLDTAGYCAIAASVLWFIAGILSCKAGKTFDEESYEEEEAVEEAVEEESNQSEQSQCSSEESGKSRSDNKDPVQRTENEH